MIHSFSALQACKTDLCSLTQFSVSVHKRQTQQEIYLYTNQKTKGIRAIALVTRAIAKAIEINALRIKVITKQKYVKWSFQGFGSISLVNSAKILPSGSQRRTNGKKGLFPPLPVFLPLAFSL